MAHERPPSPESENDGVIATPELGAETSTKETPEAPPGGSEPPPRSDNPFRSLVRVPSDKGSVFSRIYEGIYKIPGVNVVVGKMEMAFHQHFADSNEKKAVKFKVSLDSIKSSIDALDLGVKELESQVESMRQQGIPGGETLQLEIKKAQARRDSLLKEQDKTRTRFDEFSAETKLFTSERDRVADKLIEYYDKKLEPLESALEKQQTCKDQLDLTISVAASRHKKELARIEGLESKKAKIEESLRATGISDRDIRNNGAIKNFERMVSRAHGDIKAENDELIRRQRELNNGTASLNRRANPYRDRRSEFVRIKSGRPLEMDVEQRTSPHEFSGVDDIEAQTGREEEQGNTRPVRRAAEATPGTLETAEDQIELSSLISGWNEYIRETSGQENNEETIDIEDFLSATGLWADYSSDVEDFKDILTHYYKFRKKPTELFDTSFDNFFEERIGSK